MSDGQRRHLTGGVLRMAGVELADLAPQRLVAVHHALGVAGGARGERDECRVRRVGIHRARHGFLGQQLIEITSNESDDRNADAQICVVLHPPELFSGDEYLRFGGRQDVTDFLSAIEVHDRHHDGSEDGRGPERGGGLHPVGQLERDDVTGSNPSGMQTRRQPPRDVFDVAEGARVRADGGMHPKGRGRCFFQSPAQQ